MQQVPVSEALAIVRDASNLIAELMPLIQLAVASGQGGIDGDLMATALARRDMTTEFLDATISAARQVA